MSCKTCFLQYLLQCHHTLSLTALWETRLLGATAIGHASSKIFLNELFKPRICSSMHLVEKKANELRAAIRKKAADTFAEIQQLEAEAMGVPPGRKPD